MQNPETITRNGPARLDALVNDAPPCPRCDETLFVVVTDWFNAPVSWFCCICCHGFKYEPQPPSVPELFWQRITGLLQ